MASKSVATDPNMHGAEPLHGNFTDDESIHLWCADAMAIALTDPSRPLGELNDDIQSALRHLLSCEIARARQASSASREVLAEALSEREKAGKA